MSVHFGFNVLPQVGASARIAFVDRRAIPLRIGNSLTMILRAAMVA
ncbi:hypothetical protein [Streptomyces antioxidans]|nr:hypothetical protein [Streptomyces antioxidans]